MIDSDNDGVADESKTFATGFNSVQGLAWKGNDLYVANAPELTVVRDLDGDDEADEFEIIYTDLGNREHALHGLNFGPDGKLYMSKGNSKGHNQPEKYGYVAPKPFRELWDVVHPKGAADSYPPKKFTKHNYQKTYHHWDDDWGREGGVLRCDPSGQNLEIVSRGMRNPWDITMDDEFNWLGTDNDQDQGDRIIMPFFGSHFGWGHSYSSHWTGKDHLPTAPMSGPVFHGSGAGIIYYAHDQFPSAYRHVFFINDWSNGTFVYRPTWEGALLQPDGGRWERFAVRGKGEMKYRPTDLEFAPDGSIYVCGWGDDYHYDRNEVGSWLLRISHRDEPHEKRTDAEKPMKAYADWTLKQLFAELGPEIIPVRRVNAQDEIVRRGASAIPSLLHVLRAKSLTTGQQTWAVWALGRMTVENDRVNQFLMETWNDQQNSSDSLNLKIQSLRILTHRIKQKLDSGLKQLPSELISSSLNHLEPRIRLAAIESIHQAKQTQFVSQLVDRLAKENDRVVFYAGWQALRNVADQAFRKKLLLDSRANVRLAALLSLQEQHEITRDEVLNAIKAETDSRIQSSAIAFVLNPTPPKKMPNTTARIELEESVSIRKLMKLANETPSLRSLYLQLISRATYDRDDWDDLHDFYKTLQNDEERIHVLAPLARNKKAKPILWSALNGSEPVRQAAVRGFAALSVSPRNSPEQIAEYLVQQLEKANSDEQLDAAIEALFRLPLTNWKPGSDWDSRISKIFGKTESLKTQIRFLQILLKIDVGELKKAQKVKATIEQIARKPAPQMYALLLDLNPKLGINVSMPLPKKATASGVLAKLTAANAERGRELFFSKTAATSCSQCHRIDGRGNRLAPDLSGIGTRSDAQKIIESILKPSATITEGYQLQTLITKGGLKISGAVLQETDSEIRVAKTDGQIEIVPVSEVDEQIRSNQSAMPTGFEFLGDQQVADLVAFLRSSKF